MTIDLLEGQNKDLGGGLRVRRLLLALHRHAVGPFLFIDYAPDPGARIERPGIDAAAQRALYAVQDQVLLDGSDGSSVELGPHRLAVLPDDGVLQLRATAEPARVVLVGGAAPGRRHLWWNFVATRPALIEQAAAAWDADALGQVAGETERIALPSTRWRRP